MDEKKYLKYAEQIEGCNRLFDDEVARVADSITQTISDWRLSERGKEQKKKDSFAALNKTAEMIAKIAKKSVADFCNDYAIDLPEDGADHSKDIENGLKIIDMLGFNLDVVNLANVMNPLLGSFRSTKTIVDLMLTKGKASSEVGYSPEVISKLYEYTGINSKVGDYLNLFNNICDILKNPYDIYRFEVTSRSNATLVTLQPIIPYDLLACSDWMRKCGSEYAALESEFSSLFTSHVPTDRELLESIYQGK